MKQLIPSKVVTTFIAFAGFLLLSNEFDWDHFFATNEADLQSWMLHHELPLWSNQICAGVTRLGDPQAFGLSPLFLPVILFGSYFGLKVIAFLTMCLGFWSLRTIGLRCLGPSESAENKRTIVDVLVLTTLFGNYFLWHAHHGHLTFFQIPLILAMVALMITEPANSANRRKTWFALFFLSWTYFSGGFYHSIVFFALPTFLALTSVFGILLLGSWRTQTLRFALAQKWNVLSLMLGLVAGSYKVWGVLNYQKMFPRTLNGPSESSISWETLIYQLIPTADYKFVAVDYTPGPWSIWEYSAFNLTAWVGLIALLSLAIRHISKRAALKIDPVFLTAICLFCFAIWFSLGPNPYSIHFWLNVALKGSLRVVGRYQFLFTCSFFLFALIGIQNLSWLQTVLRKYSGVLVAMIVANMATFSTLSLESFFRVRGFSSETTTKMQSVGVVPYRDLSHSYMLPAVSAGYLVPNCYNPINRKILIAQEYVGRPEFNVQGTQRLDPGKIWPLVRNSTNQQCLSDTYVTSNNIHLSPSCEPGTCLNLNGLNVHSPSDPRLYIDSKLNLVCVRPP